MGSKSKVIDEGQRLKIVLSVVALACEMRDAALPKTAYSRILREAIHFVWEIREDTKHSKTRLRSSAAKGQARSELDYDHAVPMRILVEMLLNAWPDSELASHILKNMVHGVLITKDEHATLRTMKLASRMPADWDGRDWLARYRAVGITLSCEGSAQGTGFVVKHS